MSNTDLYPFHKHTLQYAGVFTFPAQHRRQHDTPDIEEHDSNKEFNRAELDPGLDPVSDPEVSLLVKPLTPKGHWWRENGGTRPATYDYFIIVSAIYLSIMFVD